MYSSCVPTTQTEFAKTQSLTQTSPPKRPLYMQPTMLVLLSLGFAGGIPLEMAMSIMPTWASAAKWSVVDIGLIALARLPYTCKVLWAPLSDHCSIIGLRWMGRRRSWLFVTQLICLGLIVALALNMDNRGGMMSPNAIIVLLGVLVFAGATQDIVGDAYRAEVLQPREFGAGASMWVTGARFASLFAGAGVLILAGRLGESPNTQSWAWAIAVCALAAVSLVGMIGIFMGREPARPIGQAPGFAASITQPFQIFASQWGLKLIALFFFLILYRLPDVLGGAMTSPLLVQGLGYSTETIGWVRQSLGSGLSIVGTIVGGLMIARWSLTRCLWIAGILAAVSNVGFWILASTYGATVAHVAPSSAPVTSLVVVLSIESICGGLATCAFVAFMMSICDVRATATQYALLTSVMAIGNTLIGVLSGWMLKNLDYQSFYGLSIVAAAPGLLLIPFLRRKSDLKKS